MRNLNCIESRLCKLCGSPFTFNAIPSKVAAGHGFFCSGACQRRGRKQRQFEDSFFERIGHITRSGCILWSGSTDSNGYGKLGTVLAHRAAYGFFVGSIPESVHVLHHCDNPTCINPVHLFLGTNLDNINDKLAKGRQAKGEMFNRKFTAPIVTEIRARHSNGESQSALAKERNVSQSLISKIVRRKIWKHIP